MIIVLNEMFQMKMFWIFWWIMLVSCVIRWLEPLTDLKCIFGQTVWVSYSVSYLHCCSKATDLLCGYLHVHWGAIYSSEVIEWLFWCWNIQKSCQYSVFYMLESLW